MRGDAVGPLGEDVAEPPGRREHQSAAFSAWLPTMIHIARESPRGLRVAGGREVEGFDDTGGNNDGATCFQLLLDLQLLFLVDVYDESVPLVDSLNTRCE